MDVYTCTCMMSRMHWSHSYCACSKVHQTTRGITMSWQDGLVWQRYLLICLHIKHHSRAVASTGCSNVDTQVIQLRTRGIVVVAIERVKWRSKWSLTFKLWWAKDTRSSGDFSTAYINQHQLLTECLLLLTLLRILCNVGRVIIVGVSHTQVHCYGPPG